jgi:hypothetical protein
MKPGQLRFRACWATMLAALFLGSLSNVANAHPERGSIKWSVILCTFTDSPAPAHDPSYYKNMFFVPGTGGMADYWTRISNGGIEFSQSTVVGWYQEPFSIAQANAQDRWTRFQSCVNAAKNATTNPYPVPAGNLIAVVTSPGIDLFGYIGYGSFLPDTVDMGAMTHEVGHGLGFQHSFSDDPNFRDASWAQIGEYDDEWDAMSWANAFGSPTAQYGTAAPAMNGPHSDYMGWVPRNQIVTFGADGIATKTLNLVPLHGSAAGTKLLRIPFDPGDLFHYYTVEFRTQSAYDAGIPAPIVMIHEWKKGDRDPKDHYLSYLIRAHTGNRDPVQVLSANGVSVTVHPLTAGAQSATVDVSTQMVDRCVQGYVWREAIPSDHVCVTGAIRSQTKQDNTLAASRRNPAGGPYGPDTCLQGYVWREAYANDHVCVTGATRSQAKDDNSHAAERRNPARMVYGPNTCTSGYVWREADSMDFVCVSGSIRTQTQQDNAAASSRRNPAGGPYGPDTCLQGFVWREAYPGDHVCVIGSTRSQARDDNSHAAERVVIP